MGALLSPPAVWHEAHERWALEKGPPRCLHSGMLLLPRAAVTGLWEINQPLYFALEGVQLDFHP